MSLTRHDYVLRLTKEMKPKAILTSLTLAFLLPLTSCLLLKDNQHTDSQIRALLVGTWLTAPEDAVNETGEKTYYADGTADGFIEGAPFGDFVYESKWKVENGVLIIYDMNFTPNTFEDGEVIFEEGEIIEDRIIEINSEYYIYEDLQDGLQDIRRRKGSNQSR